MTLPAASVIPCGIDRDAAAVDEPFAGSVVEIQHRVGPQPAGIDAPGRFKRNCCGSGRRQKRRRGTAIDSEEIGDGHGAGMSRHRRRNIHIRSHETDLASVCHGERSGNRIEGPVATDKPPNPAELIMPVSNQAVLVRLLGIGVVADKEAASGAASPVN